MTSVVVLMGVSGCGKSTIGKLLAETLGWHFEDADDQKWEVQVDVPGFKQWWCYKDGGDLMMKARSTLQCPAEDLIQTMINTDERKKWDV